MMGREARLNKGSAVTVDPTKLDDDGKMLLGELRAVARWAAMFSTMRDRCTDIQERVFLQEVVEAITEDGKRLSNEVARLALTSGAGEHVVQNAESTETPQ
jgi:hypothetical protein